jgi:membrane-bound lytic murein transglycosylase A
LRRAAGLVVAGVLLGALARDIGPSRLNLSAAGYAALDGWTRDRVAEAVPPFSRSCARVSTRPDADLFDPVAHRSEFGRIAAWGPICREASRLPADNDAAAHRFFEAEFAPVVVADYDESEGLFTGYFEIELNGSRRRDPRFHTPLYRRPPDQALQTRYSRAEIENGALPPDLALVWVDDPIAAFFLAIEGSGKVHLGDGTTLRLGYDGQNGRGYVSIGRILVERGEIARDQLTMAALRAWMVRHPAAGQALRRQDPSYVFFREIRGPGPMGAEQVVLTPRRSLAVDPAYIPFGVPIWLEAVGRYPPHRGLHRLMIAQDAGGAIKGPVRGDVFWGTGAEPGKQAGEMNARGRYFMLLPRAIADRVVAQAN